MNNPKPGYVYVASSWRNDFQPAMIALLHAAGIPHYDFRNPPNGAGFGWEQLGVTDYRDDDATGNGHVTFDGYREMVNHPIAQAGFEADMAAMDKADTFVLVMPCGRSAHLELGWAVGQGKRTAILFMPGERVEPELMYRMVDYMTDSTFDLLGWLGVED